MKHDWKKHEKQFYTPKNTPEQVIVPPFKFFTIQGSGNPNNAFFAEYIGVLYSLSYAVKMSPKAGMKPMGYFDYAVYPLEGVWDLTDEAQKNYTGNLDKNALVFTLMIRQPDFVTDDFASEMLKKTKQKKPHELLDAVKFEILEEGSCIQMIHYGSYDDEPASFKLMEQYAALNNLKRKYLTHREIYLSDARKTAPEKLKTILRFVVE